MKEPNMSDLATRRCAAGTAGTRRVALDDAKRMLTTLPGYAADMLGGLGENDFICAAKIEALVRR